MITSEQFGAAYTADFVKVRRCLQKITRAKIEDAEEVTQQAWTRGWEKRDQFVGPGRISGWIVRIAINLYLVEKRTPEVRRVEQISGEWSKSYSCDRISQVEAKCDARKLLKRVRTVTQQTLLIERYIMGLTAPEVAKLENRSEISVKMHTHHAIQFLRESVLTPTPTESRRRAVLHTTSKYAPGTGPAGYPPSTAAPASAGDSTCR